MSNEDEFFAEMHPQIAQVIGIAVMQLLVEKREPSREALIEMIQVLWQGGGESGCGAGTGRADAEGRVGPVVNSLPAVMPLTMGIGAMFK